MSSHPFIGDLSSKNMEELGETINKVANNMQFMFRTGKHEMVKQMQMVLEAYRTEYARRQTEMWNKKSQNLDKKIDIR